MYPFITHRLLNVFISAFTGNLCCLLRGATPSLVVTVIHLLLETLSLTHSSTKALF